MEKKKYSITPKKGNKSKKRSRTIRVFIPNLQKKMGERGGSLVG